MAKKSKSRINRKTKRIIRRSIAGLLMVTAIGVAAIPAKPVEADTSSTIAAKRTKIEANAAADSAYTATPSYTSGAIADLTLENAAALKPDRDPSTGALVYTDAAKTKITVNGVEKVLYPTYTISNLSSGSPEVKWQFKYYDGEGGIGGIIALYNDEYTVKNVTLPNNGVRTYAIVTQTMFDDFYATGAGSQTYTLTHDEYNTYKSTGNKTDNTKMFEKYFSAEYNNFWSLCEQYDVYYTKLLLYKAWEQRRDDWYNEDPTNRNKADYVNIEAAPENPTWTVNPSVWTGENPNVSTSVVPSSSFASSPNADALMKQFYCDNKYSTLGSGFTLVKINDRVGYFDNDLEDINGILNPKIGKPLDPSHINTVYAVSTSGATLTNGDSVDGYLVLQKSANINGIANKAFYKVGNVDVLSLPSETKYIGDEAFLESFIKEINLTNVQNIGNRAFKGCTQLATVNIGNGTKIIGTDAFYKSAVKSVKLPVTVSVVGPGAFADCQNLVTVDLSDLTTGSLDIRDYAFFDDIRINNVAFPDGGVTHIGEGAFAVSSTVSGGWTDVKLPSSVQKKTTEALPQTHTEQVEGLGNLLFAGRYNLNSVTFPDSYGLSNLNANENDIELDSDYALAYSNNVIPAGMFKGCSNLSYVEFPNTSCYPIYQPYTFYDVTNSDFYVKGPMNKGDGKAAYPRQSTWQAITRGSNFVPYIYVDSSGKENYEVSDGTYLLLANPDGTLTGCTLIPPKAAELDMVIPAKVGDYEIKTIASNCFDDDIKSRIKTLTISDGSVTEIGANAFANMPILEYLYVGDSVQTIGEKAFYNCDELKDVDIMNGTKTIGNSAFEDCEKLETVDVGNAITSVGEKVFYKCPSITDIAFASPKDGYGALTVGSDAFKTTGNKLTLHGDIHGGYALFDWALDKDNMIDNLGTRVYYKSPEPSYLGVIYDNNSGDITLVDYPKYNKLDDDHAEHNTSMENYYYELYSDAAYNDQRTLFIEKYGSSTDAERAGYASWDEYGPWIYDQGYISTLKSSQTRNDKYDFSYTDPATSTTTNFSVLPYFKNHKYSIIENDNKTNRRGDYEAPTLQEKEWIDATKNIVVPDGITSIDIQDYINGSSSNAINVQKYLKNLPEYSMYSASEGDVDNNGDPIYDPISSSTQLKSVPGLFSGSYEDYTDSATKREYETAKRGNDAIESITLTSVKKLPDKCFDSCERLTTVNLGSACEDIGTSPFRGCNNLSTVGGNDNYKYNNGIIYSVNDDGSYTIEECLSSRGNVVGTGIIKADTDPDIAKVSAIKEGAFEECDYISNVDLSPAENLTIIPEKAFKNCDMLTYVTLPESVTEIQKEAFSGDKRVSVTIPGTEVAIATDAFEHTSTATLRTYKDTAAYRYANYYGLSWDPMGEKHRVLFYDYDGKQLGEAQYVEDGKSAEEPPVPTHPGMTFTGWSGSPNNVKSDLILIAQYSGGNGGSVSGGDAGNNGSGNGGSGGSGSGSGGSGSGGSGSGGSGSGGDSTGNIHRVTVVNGSGTGDYLAGRTVTIIANTSGGRTFSNWSSNDGVAFANSTSATTTFTMPDKNVTVTAYFTTSGSVSGNNSGANRNNTAGTTGTRVAINKPGISNTNLASAKVNGSTDDFIVKISETPEATAAVERALTNEYGSLDGLKYFAMDITLWDSNGATKITDTTGLSVDITIPLPDSLKDYAGNNKTAAVVNDYLEPLTPKFTTIDKVPCVTFRATHFSPYAIYVDTGNLSEGTRPDGTPKTADGIHPKWFLSIGLAALSLILFFKRDNKVRIKNI